MQIQHANIQWQSGQPVSEQFGDVYFSRDNGLAETHHVFIQHNGLPERWSTLKAAHFTVAETGFGTGLNFLCAWQAWLEHAPAQARLHFISCEKYPLSMADTKQALSYWPQLAPLSQQLIAQYDMLSPGFHRMSFDDGRITLTLMIGDAAEMYQQLQAKVDAWFLDGFAPAKNPEMWQSSLFSQMARLSANNASFSTFTSAGIVKRGLVEAGFSVEKVSGYGSKREMLRGQFQGTSTHNTATRQNTDSSAQRPLEKKAIIVGGGIAGCATSHALAQRGWQVTLIERHASLANEASGNPVGVLYPRLAVQDTVMSRLALASFQYTTRLIHTLRLPESSYGPCGVLQLTVDERDHERHQAIQARGFSQDIVQYLTADEASQVAGIPLSEHALHFPAAGWIKPQDMCLALAQHKNIQKRLSTEALKLQKLSHGWQVTNTDGLQEEAPVLILTAANQTMAFPQLDSLPLQPVRGQISILQACASSNALKTVVCTDGYISPAIHGHHCLGASFVPDDKTLDIRISEHQHNLKMLKAMLPWLYDQIMQQDMGKQSLIGGRAALRCATPDRIPLTGHLLDHAAEELASPESVPLEGLYVNTGHGSKGLSQAPYCAEILASALNHEPLPADRQLVAALDPNRFLLRKLGLKHRIIGLTAPLIVG